MDYLTVLTVVIRVVQDPFDEHQDSHVKEQQNKEEQLWQEFQEQAVILLEISKRKRKKERDIENIRKRNHSVQTVTK